jgi:hypothetical protein
MPVAVIQEWPVEPGDRSTTNYDAVHERVMQGEAPQGLLAHTAGFDGDRFRVFEVWQSRDDFDRFVQDRLLPIVESVGGADAPPPETRDYPLHVAIVV